jgi:rubrerythrin
MEMSHEEAGRKMGVSRATFGRIVQQARRVVADALINGKAINIEGGSYRLVSEKRTFMCRKCYHQWNEPRGTGRPQRCPACRHEEFYRFLGDQKNATQQE